jgi:hypothetical protein
MWSKPTSHLCVFALMLALTGACNNRATLNVDLVAPCDRPDLLSDSDVFRVSVKAPGVLGQSAMFVGSEGKSGHIVDLPLVSDAVVQVDLWPKGVSKSAIESSSPSIVARSLPVDLLGVGGDPERLKLMIGPVQEFSTATSATGACLTLGQANEPGGRHGHTLTYVPKVNKVLIAGGARFESGGKDQHLLATLDLYDPERGTLQRLPNLRHARAYHTATAFADGRVLLVGGFGLIEGKPELLRVATLIDLTQTPVTYEENLVFVPRAFHTATLLSSDSSKVVIAGGCGQGCQLDGSMKTRKGIDALDVSRSIEVFDVASRSHNEIPQALQEGRYLHAASAIAGQRVVLSGGVNKGALLRSIEVIDGVSGRAIKLGTPQELAQGVARHSQVTLGEGERVAVLGGFIEVNESNALAGLSNKVSFWNVADGVERQVINLNTPRAGHASFTLADKSVLIVGGVVGDAQKSAERLILSGNNQSQSVLVKGSSSLMREWMGAALMPSNRVVVAGGVTPEHVSLSNMEIYLGE